MLPLHVANRVLQSLFLGAILVCFISFGVDRVRPQSSSSSSTGTSGPSSGMASSSTGTSGSSSGMASSSSAIPRFFQNNSAIEIFPGPEPNGIQTYCNTTFQGPLNQEDNTTICIIIGGVAKIFFYVNTDEFSLMQIVANGNVTGAFDNPGMWFQAEFSGQATSLKHRRPQVPTDNGYYVPFWTLIITLNNGVYSDMQWDDGCYTCSGDACVDSTCALDASTCYTNDTGSLIDCAPKFFVGWFGTDASGVYLTSAGERLSRFQEYSISSAYSSASQTADLQFNTVSDRYTFTPSCGSGTAQCCTSSNCN